MGLKPTFKPGCPKCDFKLRYHVWDPQVHPDNWVLTAESREHLATGHQNDNVIQITRRKPQPRFRKNIRPVRKVA